jgi:uncharacterized membrane protein (UPF0127 family)
VTVAVAAVSTVVTLALSIAGCGRSCVTLRLVRDDVELVSLCAFETRTEAELRAGLATIAPLAPDEALVLVYPLETDACINNAPVSYAIDAAFVDASGVVVAIERAIPAGDASDRCHARTARVVETRAEVLATIVSGDRVD